MLRDKLEPVRNIVQGMSIKQRVWSGVVYLIYALLLAGVINFTPWINGWTKFGIAILGLIIATIFIYAFLAPHYSDENEQDPAEDGPNEPEAHIPPKPKNPPSVSAKKPLVSESSEDDDFEVDDDEMTFEHLEDNPSLYRYRFSVIPVIFKVFLVLLTLILLLIVAITNTSRELWLLWVIAIPTGLVYSYYIALRWNGEEFVVNDEWYERPRTMPFPFSSGTPAIRRSEIGKYEIKQTFIDKIIKTCRLYSDTPSAGDKLFHNVKWLTHPAELRRATGISAPRKNSYLFMLRKRKQ